MGSWSNISSRKQAEQAENAARARFDLLLHGAPAVVYSFEAGSSYAPTFVSDNIKRVLGYAPDQYLKDPDFWRSRVHPEDLAAVETGQAKLFEDGRHVAEYRFRKADGIYCWVSDEQPSDPRREGRAVRDRRLLTHARIFAHRSGLLSILYAQAGRQLSKDNHFNKHPSYGRSRMLIGPTLTRYSS